MGMSPGRVRTAQGAIEVAVPQVRVPVSRSGRRCEAFSMAHATDYRCSLGYSRSSTAMAYCLWRHQTPATMSVQRR